jgi:hypothetical protein
MLLIIIFYAHHTNSHADKTSILNAHIGKEAWI